MSVKMVSHLESAKVDIAVIQKQALTSLINLIEKLSGPKVIVWDECTRSHFELIFPAYTILNDLGVEKSFPLRDVPLPETEMKHMIFITRPDLQCMDMIAQNVLWDSRSKFGKLKQYHLYLVPKFTWLCKNRLKHRGVMGNFSSIEELRVELFPFEADLISMEKAEVYNEYYLQNDPTTLHQTARSIIYLQRLYGPIPRVWGKGDAARQVWDLVKRLQREDDLEATFRNHQKSRIDQILLIDRSVDLVTPLVTQLTYEGLIDELFGLNDTYVSLPAEKLKTSEERERERLSESMESMKDVKKKIYLNSSDKLFAELRNKNFNAVGAFLSKQAKLIGAQLEERLQKSVQEMKLFVQRLPLILANKKAISQHTAIAECIKEVTDSYEFLDCLQAEQEFLNCIEVDKASPYIETLIAQKAPLIKVLRLMCLQCIANSGFRPKLLDYYKREIVQVYGIHSLLALTNLEKAGLLKVQSSSRQYSVLRKSLRLTVEDTSEVNPTDISYVHSVYAPLSVRIVEQLTKNGGKQLQGDLGLLSGPTFEDVIPTANANPSNVSDAQSVVLVFFIGGCTFAEISALRFLSMQPDSNVDFLIATTKLINGDTFLRSIIEVDEKKLCET